MFLDYCRYVLKLPVMFDVSVSSIQNQTLCNLSLLPRQNFNLQTLLQPICTLLGLFAATQTFSCHANCPLKMFISFN